MSARSLSPAHLAYIRRECVAGTAINTALSILAFLLAFGAKGAQAMAWGAGGLALDAVMQSFGVAFMSSLIPGFLAERNLRKGIIAPIVATKPPSLPRNLLLRSLVMGMTAAAMGGLVWSAAMKAASIEAMPWMAAFILKAIYGAMLGLLIIPCGLTKTLILAPGNALRE